MVLTKIRFFFAFFLSFYFFPQRQFMFAMVFQYYFHLLPKHLKYPFCAPIFHPISEAKSYCLLYTVYHLRELRFFYKIFLNFQNF